MMKRNSIMDVFHRNRIAEMGEWFNFPENKPRSDSDKVKVRLSDENEIYAYYYADKAQWIAKYGYKPSYFWDSKTHEPLLNVTSWKYLEE